MYIIVSISSVVYQGMINFRFLVFYWIGAWFCETSNVLKFGLMFQQWLFAFSISMYWFVFILLRESTTATKKQRELVARTIFACRWDLLLVISAKFIVCNVKYKGFYTMSRILIVSFLIVFQAGVYMDYIVTDFLILNILGPRHPSLVRGLEVIKRQ